MSLEKLNLIAPNGLSIAGVKKTDGSIEPVECLYDKNTHLEMWTVPKKILERDNCLIFVDSDGNEWLSNQNDIVFNTLTNYKLA